MASLSLLLLSLLVTLVNAQQQIPFTIPTIAANVSFGSTNCETRAYGAYIDGGSAPITVVTLISLEYGNYTDTIYQACSDDSDCGNDSCSFYCRYFPPDYIEYFSKQTGSATTTSFYEPLVINGFTSQQVWSFPKPFRICVPFPHTCDIGNDAVCNVEPPVPGMGGVCQTASNHFNLTGNKPTDCFYDGECRFDQDCASNEECIFMISLQKKRCIPIVWDIHTDYSASGLGIVCDGDSTNCDGVFTGSLVSNEPFECFVDSDCFGAPSLDDSQCNPTFVPNGNYPDYAVQDDLYLKASMPSWYNGFTYTDTGTGCGPESVYLSEATCCTDEQILTRWFGVPPQSPYGICTYLESTRTRQCVSEPALYYSLLNVFANVHTVGGGGLISPDQAFLNYVDYEWNGYPPANTVPTALTYYDVTYLLNVEVGVYGGGLVPATIDTWVSQYLAQYAAELASNSASKPPFSPVDRLIELQTQFLTSAQTLGAYVLNHQGTITDITQLVFSETELPVPLDSTGSAGVVNVGRGSAVFLFDDPETNAWMRGAWTRANQGMSCRMDSIFGYRTCTRTTNVCTYDPVSGNSTGCPASNMVCTEIQNTGGPPNYDSVSTSYFDCMRPFECVTSAQCSGGMVCARQVLSFDTRYYRNGSISSQEPVLGLYQSCGCVVGSNAGCGDQSVCVANWEIRAQYPNFFSVHAPLQSPYANVCMCRSGYTGSSMPQCGSNAPCTQPNGQSFAACTTCGLPSNEAGSLYNCASTVETCPLGATSLITGGATVTLKDNTHQAMVSTDSNGNVITTCVCPAAIGNHAYVESNGFCIPTVNGVECGLAETPFNTSLARCNCANAIKPSIYMSGNGPINTGVCNRVCPAWTRASPTTTAAPNGKTCGGYDLRGILRGSCGNTTTDGLGPVCTCNPDYVGYACQHSVCPEGLGGMTCSGLNRGICDSQTGHCVCQNDYVGFACEEIYQPSLAQVLPYY
jgi:hypothetical protein